MSVYIGSSFGYLKMDSWVMSKIIQLATMDFCRKFLNRSNDPCGRQFDQTTQAARAASANIAEGSARHDTSVETEMRLLDVARATLCEVIDDFTFFIMDRGLTVWSNDNPDGYRIRGIRLDRSDYGPDMLRDATQHILSQKQKFAEWLESDDMIVRANAIIILCLRTIKMLRHQLDSILETYKESGGFTENMTATRLEARKEMAASSEAPKCENCGAPMILRVAKKGKNSGGQFWSCPNYFKTGCSFTLPFNSPR